jgi:hypothetical protein
MASLTQSTGVPDVCHACSIPFQRKRSFFHGQNIIDRNSMAHATLGAIRSNDDDTTKGQHASSKVPNAICFNAIVIGDEDEWPL